MIQILSLREYPQALEQLAAWHHAQWASLSPGSELSERVSELRRHLGNTIIPATFVALEGPSQSACPGSTTRNDSDSTDVPGAHSAEIDTLKERAAEDQLGQLPKLLGSASLVEHDMVIHQELTPWLASVFVTPEARRRGVGSALIRRVMAHAAEAGYKSLFLFTLDQQALYQRLGWRPIRDQLYHGEEVTMMQIDLIPDMEAPALEHVS